MYAALICLVYVAARKLQTQNSQALTPKSLGLTMSDVQDPNLGLSFRDKKKIGKLAIIYLVQSV